MEWHPIEKAPKDGRNILIYSERHDEVWSVRYNQMRNGGFVWETVDGNNACKETWPTSWAEVKTPVKG
jgi:hypothetical protein